MMSIFSGGGRLREELSPVIESKELALSALQKSYLRSRWLDQAARADASHTRARKGYHALRLTTVVAATSLPVLAVLSVTGAAQSGWSNAVRALTILSALLVSACVVVEHLFDVGGRYRRAERMAARLLAEGWRFLQLSGPYASFSSHAEAFQNFAGQVEALSQPDVEVYNFDIVRDNGVVKAEGGAGPKEFGGSRREGTESVEPPLLMPSVVGSRQSYQRTQ